MSIYSAYCNFYFYYPFFIYIKCCGIKDSLWKPKAVVIWYPCVLRNTASESTPLVIEYPELSTLVFYSHRCLKGASAVAPGQLPSEVVFSFLLFIIMPSFILKKTKKTTCI